MNGRLIAIVIIITIILFITLKMVQALEIQGPRLIKTKWGTTDAHWSRFEYFSKDGKKVTPLYWYKDYLNVSVSEIYSTEEYNEVNVIYITYVKEADVWVRISRSIREYKLRPYTEVTVKASSTGFLAAIEPNFPSLVRGKYFLAPDYGKPLSAEESKMDGKWPLVLKSDISNNWVLIYDKNKTSTLLITNKKFKGVTSWDRGDYWQWYFAMWRFEDVKPNETYTFKYWLTPIRISANDSVRVIKMKASDLAHEALVRPVKIYENVTRGYDYWLHEVWYKFEKVENEWGLDPFRISPHNSKGGIVKDTCVATIYLPENAIAVNGPEGYPAVFSSGRLAIGLYFKDSINGPRGSDLWFGNESCGGGFYLKKFNPDKEIVKVYYITPAEPMVNNAAIKIPIGLNLSEIKEHSGNIRVLVADGEYLKFARVVVLVSMVLLTVVLAISLYSILKKG